MSGTECVNSAAGCRVSATRAGTEHPPPPHPVSVPAPPSTVVHLASSARPSGCPPKQTSVCRLPVPSPHAWCGCAGCAGCACSPSCFVRPAGCDSQPPGAAAAPAARLKCRKSRACAGPGAEPGPGQGRCQRRSTPEVPEARAGEILRNHRWFSGPSDEKGLRGKRTQTIKPGVVAHVCNPNSGEVEAGGLCLRTV